jgi:hypothetical protein
VMILDFAVLGEDQRTGGFRLWVRVEKPCVPVATWHVDAIVDTAGWEPEATQIKRSADNLTHASFPANVSLSAVPSPVVEAVLFQDPYIKNPKLQKEHQSTGPIQLDRAIHIQPGAFSQCDDNQSLQMSAADDGQTVVARALFVT